MNEWRFPAWDPVMIELWDPIHLRWYGFTYLIAFMVGQWILRRLARARLLNFEEDRVYDLIVWLVLGVLVGGRLGYAVFYEPDLWHNPLSLLQVWKGGLSFHGGLIGVCVACGWFAHKYKVDPWRITDGCAMAGLPGIGFVRFANFINGELFGRVVTGEGPPWAMRFPTDRAARRLLGIEGWGTRQTELAIRKSVHGPWEGMPKELENVPAWDTVKQGVPLRHPSQLYELIGESVVLGLVMFAVWRLTRARPLGAGVYGGIFLLGYGCVRFVLEWYRQPDEQFEKNGEIGTVLLGLSMGQILCMAMILAGAVMIVTRWNKRAPVPEAQGA